MHYSLGYLSEGKLFLSTAEGGEFEIKSAFVDGLRDRLQSIKNRSEWKQRGSGAMFARGGLPVMADVDHFEARFSAACASPEAGCVLYAIDAGDVHGIFSYSVEEKDEQRLVHGPGRRFAWLSACPEGEEVAVAVTQPDGTGCLGLMKPGRGGGVREITEGDAIDSYPAWSAAGERRSLVYQSSGIARRGGVWAGLGPAGLMRLDMTSGDLEPVTEDGKSDYLCPSYGPDGALYFIHRPYEAVAQTKPHQVLKDILFFPFRMVRAVFGFLNVFSMLFSGKPLKTAGAPQRKGPDPKAVFLYGRWVHMQDQLSRAPQEEATTAVPRSWTLRRAPAGTPAEKAETLATGVMAYTVATDGSIYYSTGRGVFRLPKAGGKAEKVSSRELVTCLFTPSC